MVKVAKKRSDIAKRLEKMGPCYFSKNTVIGKENCARLFPDDYNVEEEEEAENESCENESKKKKKKRRKKREKTDTDVDQSQSATADQMSQQDSEDTLDGNSMAGLCFVCLKIIFHLFTDLSADEEDVIQHDGKEDKAESHPPPPPSPNP